MAVLLLLAVLAAISTVRRTTDSPSLPPDGAVRNVVVWPTAANSTSQRRLDTAANSTSQRRIDTAANSTRQRRIDTWRRVQRTADVAASRRIIAGHVALCAAEARSGRVIPRTWGALDRVSFVVFSVFGNDEKQDAGHRRVFFAINVMDAFGKPRRLCRAGAMLEASVESADDKVDVDLIVEVDGAPGLYELQPHFRRAGRYALCLVVRSVNPDDKWRQTLASFDFDDAASHEPGWAAPKGTVLRRNDKVRKPNMCSFHSWANRQCFRAAVRCGDECLAAQLQLAEQRRRGGPCGAPATLDTAFRSGAWMRLPSCDGNLCAGDLREAYPADDSALPNYHTRLFNKTMWWVFVSDTCTIRLYSRAEAWRILNNKWLLNWGGSTLQQPTANMLEYMLGVPVLPSVGYMERIPWMSSHSRPPRHMYRAFDRVAGAAAGGRRDDRAAAAAERTRVTMCWGGCNETQVLSPQLCFAEIGTETRHCVRKALEWRPTSASDANAFLPAALMVNHYTWRRSLFDENAFLRKVQDTLDWIEATVHARLTSMAINATGRADASYCDMPDLLARRPLLVWIGPTRVGFGDFDEGCISENRAAYNRRMAWRIEGVVQRFARRRAPAATPAAACRPVRSVTFMSRYELTAPLHTGDEFQGMEHYGHTRGLCATLQRKKATCQVRWIRNATADWHLNQWWLNLLDGTV